MGTRWKEAGRACSFHQTEVVGYELLPFFGLSWSSHCSTWGTHPSPAAVPSAPSPSSRGAGAPASRSQPPAATATLHRHPGLNKQMKKACSIKRKLMQGE